MNSVRKPAPPRAILFDLDGTLADTAPDLAAALNHLRTERGLPEAPYDSLWPHASAGARGLIGAGLGITPEDAEFEPLRVAFLAQYERALAVNSRLFEQVPSLLQQLAARGLGWGVVTNKIARFTTPLLPQIGLGDAPCVVCGDTTPYAKPHPAPLLEAARLLGLPAKDCWYVGDDLRDIQAGQAAGMVTLAAAWGYCGKSAPESWQADVILHAPLDLLDWL